MKTNHHTSFNAAAALACVLGIALTAALFIAALETFPEARRALLIGLVLLVLAIAGAVTLAASPPAPPRPANALPGNWPFDLQADSSTEGAAYLHQLRLARRQGYEAARADAIHNTQTPNPYPFGSPAYNSWVTSYQARPACFGSPATPEKSHVTAKNA